MNRRVRYALAGALLSLGAPTGLLALRLGQAASSGLSVHDVSRAVEEDAAGFAYVAASTLTVFTLFGYVLGRQADRLAALSETDALTELANARGFFDQLEAEVSRSQRYREPLALLLIDLDGLKRINDRHGHHAGDMAIRRVGEAIRGELRESDAGARWGGDEFAIVAPNTSEQAALALAERVRATIATSGRWSVTASIGVTTLDPATDGAVDPDTLMRVADLALYDAKAAGRNRVAFRALATDVPVSMPQTG